MINVNDIINNTVSELNKLKDELNKILLNFNNDHNKLVSEKESFKEEKRIFEGTKEKVLKIENVLQREQEAKTMLKEAREKMSAFIEEKDKFENYRTETLKDINLKQNKIIEDNKYLKNEYAFLKKERELLEKEKSGYKDKVAKSIVDLANKK